ncbi:hypothetical protein AB0C02_29775 [Micromonospora sp. NPDC048999]|uniref:hypothetical protein n=1 Tax=Micromonospora sp. NPDC048999 TaxID=3155391 RepID=UPI0033EA0260
MLLRLAYLGVTNALTLLRLLPMSDSAKDAEILILKDAGIDPAPQRTSQTWAAFLRSQAQAIIAADFFEASTLNGARPYVLAIIEHATRRVRILGATAHPTAAWVAQAARNLAMDVQDAGCQVKYLIRDRDGKYPALFDAILADTGTMIVLSGVQIPRMNSIMERWIQTCRHELSADGTVSAASSMNTNMPPELHG